VGLISSLLKKLCFQLYVAAFKPMDRSVNKSFFISVFHLFLRIIKEHLTYLEENKELGMGDYR